MVSVPSEPSWVTKVISKDAEKMPEIALLRDFSCFFTRHVYPFTDFLQ